MSPLTEDDVRTRLHASLDTVDASPRPFAELHRAVAVRRRQRRAAGAALAVVVLGAGVAGGLTAVGGNGHRDGAVLQPVQPQVDPEAALRIYVIDHGGKSATPVVTAAGGGVYAADLEGGKVHVLSFDGQQWSSVAEPGSPLPGPPVVAVRPGPDGVGQDAVAFQVDVAGGDAVLNGIVVGAGPAWQYASFDCGTTQVACAGGGHKLTTYAVDGTEVDHVFHSEPNDCTPDCAAGTRYDVTWGWDATAGTFVVESSVKMQ